LSARWGTYSTILVQLVTIAYGLILPRYLIIGFGSDVNGVVSSAAQIMGYLAIFEAGLSAASIRQLYSPLVERDAQGVINIIQSVQVFYRRVARNVAVAAIASSLILSLTITSSLDIAEVFALAAAVALGPILDFRFTARFLVYFVASRQVAKYQVCQIVALLARISVVVVFALLGWNVLLMMFLIGLAPLLKAILLRRFFANEPYDLTDGFELVHLSDRRPVFGHSLLGLFVHNTPTIYIAIAIGASSASVYSVNNMIFGVFYGFSSILFNQVFTPRLGQHLVSGHVEVVGRLQVRLVSASVFLATTSVISTFVLLESFLQIYTASADVQYYDRTIASLFSMWSLFNLMKVPYQALVNASGRFANTLRISALELVVFAVVLLGTHRWFSIEGVLLALLLSTLVKFLGMKIYCHIAIMREPVIVSIVQTGVVIAVALLVLSWTGFGSGAISIGDWLFRAVATTAAVGVGSAAFVFLPGYLITRLRRS